MSRRALLLVGAAAGGAALMALILTQIVLPRSLYTASTTLTRLSGEALIQAYRTTDFLPAQDGRVLGAGDRLRTPAGGRAFITFFEGSTMALEPETEIVLSSQLYSPASQPGASAIGVQQVSGTTWSRVQRLAPPASLYQVETPAGLVLVRGSLVWIKVDPTSGRTEARSYQGMLAARGQGAEVELPPLTGTVIERGQAPEAAEPVPQLAQWLLFTTTARIWLRVIDPAYRTAGFISPGIQINQAPFALVSMPFASPATVTVPVEDAGVYEVVIEGAAEGHYQFAVQGFAEGKQTFLRALEGTIRPDRRFAANLTVTMEGGRLTGGDLSPFTPILEGEGPGKFVRTRLSVAGVSQTATAVVQEGTPTPIVTRTPTVTRTAVPTETPTATETPAPIRTTAPATPRPAATVVATPPVILSPAVAPLPPGAATPTYTPGPAP